MASVTKLSKQPAQREAAMLERGPGGGAPYDQVAPGLYPDETAYELADGTKVAVSVERHWQENGGGLAFHAFARWIEDDGSTKLSPNGRQVESAITWNSDHTTLEQYGVDEIASELARAVVGEEPQLKRSVPVDGGPDEEMPVIALPAEVRMNASIRAQIKAVKASAKHSFEI